MLEKLLKKYPNFEYSVDYKHGETLEKAMYDFCKWTLNRWRAKEWEKEPDWPEALPYLDKYDEAYNKIVAKYPEVFEKNKLPTSEYNKFLSSLDRAERFLFNRRLEHAVEELKAIDPLWDEYINARKYWAWKHSAISQNLELEEQYIKFYEGEKKNGRN